MIVLPRSRRTTNARSARARVTSETVATAEARIAEEFCVGNFALFDEGFEIGGGGVDGFGADDKGGGAAFGQRQIEPSGAVGVALGGLAARGFDGMQDVFAPLGLRVIDAVIREHAQAAVDSGCEFESCLVAQRAGV